MGSGVYTFEEAKGRLNRSKRSLHLYVKKGLIRKSMQNGQVVLDREDVDLMATDIGANLPPMNKKTFFQMQIRFNKMEDEMRAVKHALELRDSPPLRPDQNTSGALITACSTYLQVTNKEEAWTPDLVDQWTDLFERMDEETFLALTKAANDPQVWSTFFKFCSELLDFCWQNDRRIPSLEWQGRAKRLDMAKHRLRGVIVVMVEMGMGVVPKQFLEALGSNRAALLSRVTS